MPITNTKNESTNHPSQKTDSNWFVLEYHTQGGHTNWKVKLEYITEHVKFRFRNKLSHFQTSTFPIEKNIFDILKRSRLNYFPTVIPSQWLKKVLIIYILKSSRLTQFYYFLTINLSPWLKKFLKIGILNSSRSTQVYYLLIIIPFKKKE